jgi:uncharacterized protein (DUF362 family)
MRYTRRQVFHRFAAAAAASAAIRGACPATVHSMPGLFPGRVIGVKHADSSIAGAFQTQPIQSMVRRGMMELTGAPDDTAAWKKLFSPGDVVGIKVNPNGISSLVSSKAAIGAIVQGLLSAGVARENIVICDRNRVPLNGMAALLPAGVRQAAASWDWSADQTEIAGYNPTHDAGVGGYNPAYFVDCPAYLLPWQNPANPAHTRSYVANFVTQATKIVSLAVLKDHQAAGVTLGLKNLCQGCVNNVNRAHPDAAKNYLQWFVPTVVAQPVIRNKVVLSIIDGIHGLWNAGPKGVPDFVWDHHTMYFGTDVVATDRVGWKAIDAQRVLAGLPPEESSRADRYDSWTVRQPEHITQAGLMGLGKYRDEEIDYRLVTLT